MDCNMRSPLQWDWENLIMFNQSQTETHKKLVSSEWEIEKGEGIESVVPCFNRFEGVSTGSGNNFWQTSLSKSSQSTSINSSSSEIKSCKIASESIPEDSCSNIDFVQVKASPAFEVSVGSAESFLGLKLGKRTYFEDFCGGNNNDISAVSMKFTPSVALKKSKSTGHCIQVPRCQVEGCDLDLSSSKDYHRKHRVCENHSKCPKVIVAGLERRFCQQCSRFHALTEFDDKKRSCRKRLSHHNARRRKPQGVFPLNPARVYDRRQHTNMSWNGLSLTTRWGEKFSWGSTYDTKSAETEGRFTLSFQRGNNASGEQLFGSSGSLPLRSLSTFQNSSEFSGGKSNVIGFQMPGKGVEEYSISPGGLHEAQDFHRALSLLSTTSQDSRGTKHVPLSRHTSDAEPQPQPQPQPQSQSQPQSQPMSDHFPTLFI